MRTAAKVMCCSRHVGGRRADGAMRVQFDACFSPELEVAADAFSGSAGFLSRPGPTYEGTRPARASTIPCLQYRQVRVAGIAPEQRAAFWDRGVC